MVNITNSGRRVPALIGISSGLSSARKPSRSTLASASMEPSVDHRRSSASVRLNVTSMRFISWTASSE